MLYQIATNLHKLLDEINNNCTTEHVNILANIVCTSRQVTFEILRANNVRMGMNTTANKLYHVNKLIGLNALALSFVHFKKLMKIQFLKFGKT